MAYSSTKSMGSHNATYLLGKAFGGDDPAKELGNLLRGIGPMDGSTDQLARTIWHELNRRIGYEPSAHRRANYHAMMDEVRNYMYPKQ